MIKLVLLYEQIIKEVGDLENITPYEWNKISKIKYNFLDKDGDKIYVDFQLYDKNDLESIEFSSNIQDPTKVYNVSYSLQGKQSQ
jgi:hypothetical protein